MTSRARTSTSFPDVTRPRYGSASGTMNSDAMRMIRGRPFTVSWLNVSPGSEASITARCSSARRSRVANTTVRTRISSRSSTPSSCSVSRVKKSSSSRTRSASNSTSLPPGNIRYRVARDTPASAAMSSMVTFSMPHRSQHALVASSTRASVFPMRLRQ